MAPFEAVLASAPEWPAIMQAFKDRLEDNSIVTEDEIRRVHCDASLLRLTLTRANATVHLTTETAGACRTSRSPLADLYDVRVAIVDLLIQSLAMPAPNIAHLLLGFDVTRPIRSTVLQGPRSLLATFGRTIL